MRTYRAVERSKLTSGSDVVLVLGARPRDNSGRRAKMIARANDNTGTYAPSGSGVVYFVKRCPPKIRPRECACVARGVGKGGTPGAALPRSLLLGRRPKRSLRRDDDTPRQRRPYQPIACNLFINKRRGFHSSAAAFRPRKALRVETRLGVPRRFSVVSSPKSRNPRFHRDVVFKLQTSAAARVQSRTHTLPTRHHPPRRPHQ